MILTAPRTTDASADIPARLAVIIDLLCRMAAAHAPKTWSAAPMLRLLWPYLRRLVRRFDALVIRLEAGCARVRAQRPRAARAAAARAPRLPRGFGWLVWAVPYEAACLGSQLQHLLADPAMVAILTASPQAGRMLRPLCRMLAMEPGPDLPASLFAVRPRRAPAVAAPPERTAPSLSARFGQVGVGWSKACVAVSVRS